MPLRYLALSCRRPCSTVHECCHPTAQLDTQRTQVLGRGAQHDEHVPHATCRTAPRPTPPGTPARACMQAFTFQVQGAPDTRVNRHVSATPTPCTHLRYGVHGAADVQRQPPWCLPQQVVACPRCVIVCAQVPGGQLQGGLGAKPHGGRVASLKGQEQGERSRRG